MKRILLFFIAVLMLGCSASGPKYDDLSFETQEGYSEIYIYRVKQFGASGRCYEIGLNGAATGVLANGGFLRAEVLPGSHVVSVPVTDNDLLELEIETQEDSPVYVQYNFALNNARAIPGSEILSTREAHKSSMGALMNFHNLLVQVRPEYALKILKDLSYSSGTYSCGFVSRYKN